MRIQEMKLELAGIVRRANPSLSEAERAFTLLNSWEEHSINQEKKNASQAEIITSLQERKDE